MLKSSCKQKGKRFEEEWAKFLKETNLDPTASRNPSSGGGLKKGDIKTQLDYHFECKKVEKLNIWSAIQQAERDASLVNKTPCVIISKNFLNEPWVLLPASKWAELEKLKKEANIQSYTPHLKWKINNAIKSLKDLLKEIDL